MRPARRPADHTEATDATRVHARQQLGGEAEQRAPRDRRAAAVDGQQTNAELGSDPVVWMARQPRVASAVEVDDGNAGTIADIVDDQRGVTIKVAIIPSAR
jgi:hypothetical protein